MKTSLWKSHADISTHFYWECQDAVGTLRMRWKVTRRVKRLRGSSFLHKRRQFIPCSDCQSYISRFFSFFFLSTYTHKQQALSCQLTLCGRSNQTILHYNASKFWGWNFHFVGIMRWTYYGFMDSSDNCCFECLIQCVFIERIWSIMFSIIVEVECFKIAQTEKLIRLFKTADSQCAHTHTHTHSLHFSRSPLIEWNGFH